MQHVFRHGLWLVWRLGECPESGHQSASVLPNETLCNLAADILSPLEYHINHCLFEVSYLRHFF